MVTKHGFKPLDRLSRIYAENTKPLVPFVGAGLSSPAGLPDWRTLRSYLEKTLEEKIAGLHLDPASKAKRESALSAIRSATDYWLVFDILRREIGRATYTASIREVFKDVDRLGVPPLHLQLWSLNIPGIVTVNLDRLVSRALVEQRPSGIPSHEFNGQTAGQYLSSLKSRVPFIINLHGRYDESDSWVFARSELRALQSTAHYEALVLFLFSHFTVVFMGISADDIATGGLLEGLVRKGIDTGDHFWITSRGDEETDDWAEQAGLQVIRYDSKCGHQEKLASLIATLKSSRSYDEPAAPPVYEPSRYKPISLPSPQDLAISTTEDIRMTLAAEAARILEGSAGLVASSPGDDDALNEYKEFTHRYRRAVANSFVTEDPPDNVFFGYRVEGEIASGAFGQVYKAVDADGAPVAIKVLRQEVIRNDGMLQSFRRGVNSMRILRRRDVPGMIAYREAYELPPCTIMDYVPGLNLEAAREWTDYIDYWRDPIFIALEIARIVRRAHNLPERVLHRDIRPANVMLKWNNDRSD